MLKYVTLAVALVFMASSVYARPYNERPRPSQSSGSQTVNIDNSAKGSDLDDMVPDAYAPSIGTGTCMGVVSGSVAVSGFGVAGGGSVNDEECQLRYNSVRLEELGQDEAATQIMCMIPAAKQALEVAGFQCKLGADVGKSEVTSKSSYDELMGG